MRVPVGSNNRLVGVEKEVEGTIFFFFWEIFYQVDD